MPCLILYSAAGIGRLKGVACVDALVTATVHSGGTPVDGRVKNGRLKSRVEHVKTMLVYQDTRARGFDSSLEEVKGCPFTTPNRGLWYSFRILGLQTVNSQTPRLHPIQPCQTLGLGSIPSRKQLQSTKKKHLTEAQGPQKRTWRASDMALSASSTIPGVAN